MLSQKMEQVQKRAMRMNRGLESAMECEGTPCIGLLKRKLRRVILVLFTCIGGDKEDKDLSFQLALTYKYFHFT